MSRHYRSIGFEFSLMTLIGLVGVAPSRADLRVKRHGSGTIVNWRIGQRRSLLSR